MKLARHGKINKFARLKAELPVNCYHFIAYGLLLQMDSRAPLYFMPRLRLQGVNS